MALNNEKLIKLGNNIYKKYLGDEKLLSLSATEVDYKRIINVILKGANLLDNITIPFNNKIDVTVSPNQYLDVFSYNNILAKLYLNDSNLFNNIASYNNIMLFDKDKTYYKNDRILYFRTYGDTLQDRFNIYICLKDEVSGVYPSTENTCLYYQTLYNDVLPEKYVFAEECVTLNSFNTNTEGYSLSTYNRKPFNDLSSFNFKDNNIISSEISIENQLKSLKDNSELISFPTNPVTNYSTIELSSLSSTSDVENVLYTVNPSEVSESISSINTTGDFVISSLMYNDENYSAYYREYKSGFVEQGGKTHFKYSIKEDRGDSIILGSDTYLIGVSQKSSMCVRVPIKSLVSADIMTLGIQADVCNYKFNTDNIKEYIYNINTVFEGDGYPTSRLTPTYNTPIVYFSGIVTDCTSQENLPVDLTTYEYPTLSCEGCICWESQGIKV